MIGKTLAHYQVTELLGKGGMGEVYRARDTKLDRDVALKLLPLDVASDPERLARFRREAKVLASLNHPNIAAIYGLEEEADAKFLVMELVEGEDLTAWLERGPLPLDQVLEVGRQLALGLEEAHAKGVVHRDLKPANIKVSPEGKVKILDFGLARAFVDDPPERVDVQNSPTITAAMTHPGIILGTASYMSPEQARGDAVDARTDVWAFGVVLWEMLQGRQLFDGRTTSDALAGVLKTEIDLDALPRDVPPPLRRVLRRCLVHDRNSRLHSIADARIEIEEAQAAPSGEPVEARSRSAPPSSRLAWILVLALAVLSMVLMARPWDRGAAPIPAPARLSLVLPDELHISLLDWEAFAVAPDGSALAMITDKGGRHEVRLYEFESGELRVLSDNPLATGACFSADSRWIAYFADGRFWKVSVDGGSPVEIHSMSHWRGASWSEDGFLYYSPTYATGIHRIHESGRGEPEVLTQLNPDLRERTHRWPQVLPEGRGVVFTVGTAGNPGDYEDAELAVYDARDGSTRYLGIRGAMARYLPSGHLIVARRGTLLAARFDLDKLELTSSPIPVFDGVAGDVASGIYYFEVSPQGHLYYIAEREGGPQRTLAWISRDGTVESLGLEPSAYRYPRIDPSGSVVAFVMGEGHGGADDLYQLDLRTKAMHRFTFNQGSVTCVWSPDGEDIYYADLKKSAIMVRDALGTAPPRRLASYQNTDLPASISNEGRYLFVTSIGGPTLGDVYALDLSDTNSYEPVINSPAAEWGSMISPDGTWIAYVSDETGREEIFVQPFPTTGSKWQVSDRGGRSAIWSPDGDEIIFMNGDRFYSAKVSTDPVFRAQTPQFLFEHPIDGSGIPRANYDISPIDGRFLVVEADKSRRWRRLEVVLHWAQRLDELDD